MSEENCQDAVSKTPNDAENLEAAAETTGNAQSSEFVADSSVKTLADDAESADRSENVEKSATLEEALKKCGVELPAKKVALLKEYCELLWTWNERVNLTRHNDFDKFVSRDLVDSMELAKQFQKGEHVLDVGSGGGVPGLVLAILRPDITVELCDSTGKKAEALGAIVDGLGLDLNVWYAKAEDLLKAHRFHSLAIRAVGKIHKLLSTFAPLWYSFDRILMIKGPNWVAERGEARHYNVLNNVALRKVAEYENPGAEHGSVILQFCRKSRFEEIERRAQDRAEGKPIDREVEPVEVDDAHRDVGRDFRNDGRRRGFGNRNRGRNVGRGRDFFDAKNRRGGENAIERSDAETLNHSKKTGNLENSASGGDFFGERDKRGSRVFARRDGKAPKGWTGKKREFRAETDGGSDVEKGENRSGGKRFGGKSRGGENGGSASRSGGARFGKRPGGKFSDFRPSNRSRRPGGGRDVQ